MQDEHPDRLKTPLERVEGRGFERIGWEPAMERIVGEIRRIQESYGKDAFAMLTGASLTNEKAYVRPLRQITCSRRVTTEQSSSSSTPA